MVVERVHVLCMHADVDGGRRHLACACGHGWGTWTPCVCVDGLLWMQMSIKKKQKSTYLHQGTGEEMIFLDIHYKHTLE